MNVLKHVFTTPVGHWCHAQHPKHERWVICHRKDLDGLKLTTSDQALLKLIDKQFEIVQNLQNQILLLTAIVKSLSDKVYNDNN